MRVRIAKGVKHNNVGSVTLHYYQFNISDYLSHTQHFDEMEDLAYRRMLDLYYLHESPLPEDIQELAKLIRMRTHSDCIAYVLQECFKLKKDGYHNARADKEIKNYKSKSDKASASAKARWAKTSKKNNKIDDDANAMRTHSEGNAKHKTLNIKQEPISKANRFTIPTQHEVASYFQERGSNGSIQQAETFYDFYSSKGWMVGKNKMRDWKAAVRNWMKRDSDKPVKPKQTHSTYTQIVNDDNFEF